MEKMIIGQIVPRWELENTISGFNMALPSQN